jgi:hypothetical protein
MNHLGRTPALVAALSIALGLTACRIANEDFTADGGAADAGATSTPSACATNADCAGACFEGALDCVCAPRPSGPACAAACRTRMDCPADETCTMGGFCVTPGGQGHGGGMQGQHDGGPSPMQDAGPMPPPDGGPGGSGPQGGKSCATEADCQGACPQGSAGCTCHESPQGLMCVPTCASAADCPVLPGQPPFACNTGVCVPQNHP